MYKIQNRVMLSRYRGRTLCTVCGGTRLRKEANYFKINGIYKSHIEIFEKFKMPLKIKKFSKTKKIISQIIFNNISKDKKKITQVFASFC